MENKRQWALDKLDELIEKTGSQNKAAGMVGISSAILSQMRAGKYTGNEEKQLIKLISYFETKDAAQEVYTEGDYAPTSISQSVYEVIRNCQVKGGLAIACGDAGIGKTKAAKKFVADSPSNSVYIALNPCLTGLKSILKILAAKVNADSDKRIDDMWLSIAAKLNDGMVIIFDEAQHLPLKTIEALRAFSDYFADNGQTLGIVFIGNSETVSAFSGNKKAEFAQISNRTKQRKLFCTQQIRREDILLLFPLLEGKDKEVDFLHGIARSKQAIRGASNLFGNAFDNEDISYDGLVAMAKHMEMRI